MFTYRSELACHTLMIRLFVLGYYTYTHTERSEVRGERVERTMQLNEREYQVKTRTFRQETY